MCILTQFCIVLYARDFFSFLVVVVVVVLLFGSWFFCRQRDTELRAPFFRPVRPELTFSFKKQNENIFVFRFTVSGKREENYGLERERNTLEDADVPVPKSATAALKFLKILNTSICFLKKFSFKIRYWKIRRGGKGLILKTFFFMFSSDCTLNVVRPETKFLLDLTKRRSVHFHTVTSQVCFPFIRTHTHTHTRNCVSLVADTRKEAHNENTQQKMTPFVFFFF